MLDLKAAHSGSKEIEQQMDELVAAVHTSDLYQELQGATEELRRYPELYKKVNEYRTRRFYNQIAGQEMWDSSLSDLRRECMAEMPAKRFLDAELDYCRLLRRIGRQFYEGTQIDLEFLED